MEKIENGNSSVVPPKGSARGPKVKHSKSSGSSLPPKLSDDELEMEIEGLHVPSGNHMDGRVGADGDDMDFVPSGSDDDEDDDDDDSVVDVDGDLDGPIDDDLDLFVQGMIDELRESVESVLSELPADVLQSDDVDAAARQLCDLFKSRHPHVYADEGLTLTAAHEAVTRAKPKASLPALSRKPVGRAAKRQKTSVTGPGVPRGSSGGTNGCSPELLRQVWHNVIEGCQTTRVPSLSRSEFISYLSTRDESVLYQRLLDKDKVLDKHVKPGRMSRNDLLDSAGRPEDMPYARGIYLAILTSGNDADWWRLYGGQATRLQLRPGQHFHDMKSGSPCLFHLSWANDDPRNERGRRRECSWLALSETSVVGDESQSDRSIWQTLKDMFYCLVFGTLQISDLERWMPAEWDLNAEKHIGTNVALPLNSAGWLSMKVGDDLRFSEDPKKREYYRKKIERLTPLSGTTRYSGPNDPEVKVRCSGCNGPARTDAMNQWDTETGLFTALMAYCWGQCDGQRKLHVPVDYKWDYLAVGRKRGGIKFKLKFARVIARRHIRDHTGEPAPVGSRSPYERKMDPDLSEIVAWLLRYPEELPEHKIWDVDESQPVELQCNECKTIVLDKKPLFWEGVYLQTTDARMCPTCKCKRGVKPARLHPAKWTTAHKAKRRGDLVKMAHAAADAKLERVVRIKCKDCGIERDDKKPVFLKEGAFYVIKCISHRNCVGGKMRCPQFFPVDMAAAGITEYGQADGTVTSRHIRVRCVNCKGDALDKTPQYSPVDGAYFIKYMAKKCSCQGKAVRFEPSHPEEDGISIFRRKNNKDSNFAAQ